MSLEVWIKKIHWGHTILLTLTPVLAVYGALTTELQTKTMIWAIVYYFITGMGITSGYHRLWSHKSYQANLLYRFFMMLAGTGAIQGSIKWWCRGHRAHHRYTDTDQDPYSAQRGLWHCHIGWLILRSDQGYLRKIDISDLLSDPMVRWQHKYYIYLAAFMGFVFPSLVAGLGWGDYRGGFYIAGVARLVFLHHATFCVNSLAHYLGEATYDDNRSPRDHFITALITFGEGYHNFHHEFPQDYRNGIKFYHYDPTKWLIQLCSYFGFTYNLLEFSSNEIEKGRLQMQQKKIDEQMHSLDWGVPIEELPQWTIEDFRNQCHRTPNLLIIDRMVYDVSKFIETHPGGPGYLKSNSGKDVTHMYNGGVYNHSNAARNLMAKFRIAVIKKGEDQLKGEKEE